MLHMHKDSHSVHYRYNVFIFLVGMASMHLCTHCLLSQLGMVCLRMSQLLSLQKSCPSSGFNRVHILGYSLNEVEKIDWA